MYPNIVVKYIKIPSKHGFAVPDPVYATPGSAGLDLSACIDEPLVIHRGDRVKVPTGIAVQMPGPGVVGLVFARSGLATKHGIVLSNSVGVIDSDYTGEILCGLLNGGAEDYTVNPGDRIAQLVFVPVFQAEMLLVGELDSTERGSGGFGSTGVR